MNSLVKICPNCKQHIMYSLDKQLKKMKCKCGFSYSMNIKIIPISSNKNPLFKDSIIGLQKGNKLLNSGFKTYKRN